MDPLTHGLGCPRCGSSLGRHGLGGASRCKHGAGECPGVVCECERSHFVHRGGEMIWRRSPCPAAVCKHCGWTGPLWSIDFERTYGLSRCQNTPNGCHDVQVTAMPQTSPPTRSSAWRRSPDPVAYGLECPRCGARHVKHGRGGKRRCIAGDVPRCPGLSCSCPDGPHFVERLGTLFWRRSPCPSASCGHCGWTGTLRGIEFEHAYGLSRCPGSDNGCHDVKIIGSQREYPGDLVLRIYCQNCTSVGHVSIDPIDGILWFTSEGAMHEASPTSNPGDLLLQIHCKRCSCVGHVSINPVDGISWVEGGKHASE